jgi:hypothetical protein
MPIEDKRGILGGLALCLVAVLIVLSFFRMYYIGGSGTADLLWNQDEGYLFVYGARHGYRISYPGYLAEMIKESLYLVPSSDGRKPFTLILHITPSGVKRYEFPSIFERYAPINQTIFAAHEGTLWKWTGNQFEAASAHEEREIGGTDGLARKDFTDVNGWSGRYSITSERFNRITTDIGKKPLTISVKTINAINGEVSIDIETPGRPDETIYHMSFRARRVSKAEYEKAFPES